MPDDIELIDPEPSPEEIAQAFDPAPEPMPVATLPTPSVSVEDMIVRAIDKGVSVETMERLLAMRRELKAEVAKEAFDKSMAQFQRRCPPIRKSKKVFERGSATKVRYAYAPLEAIVEQTKELIAEHGFSYSIDAKVEVEAAQHWVTALCKVTHAQGHSQVSQFKVPIDKDAYMNESQKHASALTFAKRYAFISAFGIMTADEDDDSAASADKAPAPQARSEPPGQASAPAPVSGQGKALEMRPSATAAHKTRLIEILGEDGDLNSIAVEFFERVGALLPGEELSDLPLSHVPVTVEQKDALLKAINGFGAGEEARLPYPLNPVTVRKAKEQPAKPAAESNDAQKQSWYGIIVPIPRKGQTRNDYLKAPDTIGSLYEARHGTDDLAQEARQRLYGFLHNYEPKGWTKRDGTQMPPSEADIKFRHSLDEFGKWWEKWHAGEKI